MPAGTQLAERMWFVPDSTLLAPASRAILGKKMEIYAGLVENLDHHVGRLIDHLKKIGEYDNTIFIVFGDNGAEGGDLFELIAGSPGSRDFLWAAMHWSNNNPNAWGDPGSWLAYGPDVGAGLDDALQPVQGMARGRRHPQRAHRQWAGGQAAQGEHQPRHSCTLPTSCRRCSRWPARAIPRITRARKYLQRWASPGCRCWRAGSNRRARTRTCSRGSFSAIAPSGRANWKLRWEVKPFGKGDWELFDVAADPGELKDLAAERPDKVKEMVVLWDDYVRRNNVVLPNRSPYEALEKSAPAAGAGPGRLPARQPEEAVRTATRHAGGAQAVTAAGRRTRHARRTINP